MFKDTGSEDDVGDIFARPVRSRAGLGDDIAARDGSPVTARQMSDAELDSTRMKALHRRLWGLFLYEVERQGANREEMSKDAAFYDNDQWSESDKQVLRERGQIPLVYNVISTTINWLIGTERRGRTDFKVLPRRADEGHAAELKTQLMKYISDVNSSEFGKSLAFQDAVKVGIGWLESGAREGEDGEPIYDRRASWRDILWDSTAQELDLSDARFIARHKWVDEDVAVAMKKSRAETVRHSRSDDTGGSGDDLGDEFMDSNEDYYADGNLTHRRGDLFGYINRPRVRMVEMWFTQPVETERIRGGRFNGEVYDRYSRGHVDEVTSGNAELFKSVYMRMHVALMTSDGFIHVSESPYRHNRFPFTPVWCYREDKTGLPYGVIRGLRDIQQDINKRASKALHILSTNKVIMDKGAVDDIDAFEEEVSRADAIIVKNPGKELTLNADRELAPAHLDLMSRSIAMIQQASGVTDESLGRTTNATSGRAIIARQDQGALATAAIFDNFRLGCKIHGEKMLSLIEQFLSEEKEFRITNSRGVATFVKVNDGLPENDIVRTKADFIISEDQWRASYREAAVQSLLNAVGAMQLPPEAFMAILDLIVEMLDIPFREEIVARIRNLTGMKDPDADPNAPPTPEEQARMQAEAAAQELQRRMAEAEVADKEASAEERRARAAKAGTDLKKVLASIAGDNVAAQRAALEVAMALLAAPQAADVADSVLDSAGYAGASGAGGMPDAPSGMPPLPPGQIPAPIPPGGGVQPQPAI